MTMVGNAKQREERLYLDRFFETIQLEPKSIERGEDPPDFLVATDEGFIAIEETSFHSGKRGADGSPRRRIEEELYCSPLRHEPC